jgi:hypothetical protein
LFPRDPSSSVIRCANERRLIIPYNASGNFRHYPELDQAAR